MWESWLGYDRILEKFGRVKRRGELRRRRNSSRVMRGGFNRLMRRGRMGRRGRFQQGNKQNWPVEEGGGEGWSGEGTMVEGKEMGRILARHWEGGVRPVGGERWWRVAG